MTLNLAINGFGRIGRNIMRAIEDSGRTDMKIVAINDLAPTDNLAHLLKYDSVHGRFRRDIKHTKNSIDIGKGPIEVTAIRNLEDQNWADNDVDIMMECTGIFRDRASAAKHLEAGAKRVLISAPGKNVDNTVVYGVNDHTLSKSDLIVSNGSCTTNALAPIAKVLNDTFGIKNGFMTTVHAYTTSQPVLDTLNPKDFNRGRAAALSMIPTSTGAAKAISLVLPELKGKLNARAIRVPTPNVSVVDLTVNIEKAADVDAVNDAFRKAAKTGPMKNILQVIDDKVVSVDLNHDPHSSSLMSGETVVMNGNFIRVLSWYDNEWGFSNRMLDTAAAMAKLI